MWLEVGEELHYQYCPNSAMVDFNQQDPCRKNDAAQITPQLFSRGWVDPVPDPLLLRKSGSAGNRTRDLWICSQELWSLDQRGGHSI
jgi:hypothetical protein